MADGSLGQLNSATEEALLGETDQRLGIGAGAEVGGEHGIVAGHLALEREPRLDKPDRRMKEEDRLHEFLREVGPVVLAAQVREFVQEDGVEFGGRNLGQRPRREDDHGAEVSDGRGDANRIGGAQSSRGGALESRQGWRAGPGRAAEVDRSAGSTQALQTIQTVADMSKAESGADDPGDEQVKRERCGQDQRTWHADSRSRRCLEKTSRPTARMAIATKRENHTAKRVPEPWRPEQSVTAQASSAIAIPASRLFRMPDAAMRANACRSWRRGHDRGYSRSFKYCFKRCSSSSLRPRVFQDVQNQQLVRVLE